VLGGGGVRGEGTGVAGTGYPTAVTRASACTHACPRAAFPQRERRAPDAHPGNAPPVLSMAPYAVAVSRVASVASGAPGRGVATPAVPPKSSALYDRNCAQACGREVARGQRWLVLAKRCNGVRFSRKEEALLATSRRTQGPWSPIR
jgi:hypothetical protein